MITNPWTYILVAICAGTVWVANTQVAQETALEIRHSYEFIMSTPNKACHSVNLIDAWREIQRKQAVKLWDNVAYTYMSWAQEYKEALCDETFNTETGSIEQLWKWIAIISKTKIKTDENWQTEIVMEKTSSWEIDSTTNKIKEIIQSWTTIEYKTKEELLAELKELSNQ